MGKYNQFYGLVQDNQKTFEELIKKLRETEGEKKKENLACFLLWFATYHNTGYFTSSVLEKFFVDMAKSISLKEKNISYEPNSFLHVLTEGSPRGGHTRVVERWIKNAPLNQKHSVVFLKKLKKELSQLKTNVEEKNGAYICLDKVPGLKDKALELRKLALGYQYVICHTNMEDPTATVAFGTEEFTRPVAFYNHASHLFWIGKSMADVVLDIIQDDEITEIKRGIKNTFFVGVPLKEITYQVSDKNALRQKLKLPTDKKIIVSSGSIFKFKPIGKNSMIPMLEKMIDEDTYCYLIGPSLKEKMWRDVYKKTNGHIIPLGYVNFNAGFLDYLSAADVYLDSYPLFGGTAMIDAIAQSTPGVSLKQTLLQFDYLTASKAFCETQEEFIEKAVRVLNDKDYAKEVLNDLKANLEKYQSIKVWNNKMAELLKVMPEKHHVQDLSGEKDYHEIDDLAVLCNILTDKEFLKRKKRKMKPEIHSKKLATWGVLEKRSGIRYVFEILKYRNYNGIIKAFEVFGIRLPFVIQKY